MNSYRMVNDGGDAVLESIIFKGIFPSLHRPLFFVVEHLRVRRTPKACPTARVNITIDT